VDLGDTAPEGRGQLDLGLLGLDQEDGLVLRDLLALGDQHLHDLGLGQPLAEVGQLEVLEHRRRDGS
jgi:hypothetical protein